MKTLMRLMRYMAMACLPIMAACVEDMDVPTGWLSIGQPIRMEETRADIDYLVSIQRGGIIMPSTPLSAIEGPVRLSSATGYTLLAESCTPAQAECEPNLYGQPRYAGTANFDIHAGMETSVNVTCSMANAAFQVVEDASFHYTSYEVTASVEARTIRLTDSQTTAYFNVDNSGQATLTFTVRATDDEGHTGLSSGTLTLKARTLSRLTLKANNDGQVGLQVSYDDHFAPGNTAEEEI